jgi:iron complex transport system ATP-binding protein
MAGPVVEMERAALRAENRARIVGPVDWMVHSGERWVLLGANGSGKTSLLRLAGAERRPTSGLVRVLGGTLGRVDMRALRARIGVASAAVADQLRMTIAARDVVMSARHGALETWWHDYTADDAQRAQSLLEFMGCAAFGDRQLATLSQGERQRVMLARALMAEPELILLDEPAAGLDLPSRESLVERLEVLAADPSAPTMLLVTHHVEEIPSGITHALVLRNGVVVSCGPVGEALTASAMSEAYGLDVALDYRDGRWSARGVRDVATRGRRAT